MAPALVLCLGLVGAAPLSGAAELERAKELAASLQFKEVIKAVDRALAADGNDRATVLFALELKGVAFGSLKDRERAQAAFARLLTIDPAWELHGKYAPRVMTPFYEARAEVQRRGPLDVDVGWADGAVTVRVKSDRLKLLVAARVHVRSDGGAWETKLVPFTGGVATAQCSATREVAWWVEALGASSAALVVLASEASPSTRQLGPVLSELRVPPPEPVVAPLPPPPPPPVALEPVVSVSATPSHHLRTAGLITLGAGVAAGGAGAIFGLLSKDDRAAFTRAVVNGAVVGLTREAALALEQRAILRAQTANVLFIAAGVLAASGGVLWLLDGWLAVTPTRTGVVVQGALP